MARTIADLEQSERVSEDNIVEALGFARGQPRRVMTMARFALERDGSLRGEREGYPAALEDLQSPPERIYGIGDPSALVRPSIAIGARGQRPMGSP